MRSSSSSSGALLDAKLMVDRANNREIQEVPAFTALATVRAEC